MLAMTRTGRSLVERLGVAPDARLVIVNCDDLGSSLEANAAIYNALRTGAATSATLMVPCPGADEACARYDGEDVGVHLTVTSRMGRRALGPAHPGAVTSARGRHIPQDRPRRPYHGLDRRCRE